MPVNTRKLKINTILLDFYVLPSYLYFVFKTYDNENNNQ